METTKKKHKIIWILLILVLALAAGAGYVYYRYFYADKPEDDLKAGLEAVVSKDKETADLYISYDSFYHSGSDDASLYSSLMKDFSYRIDSVHVEDNGKASASVTVSNRDMQKIYGDFVTDACQQVIDNESLPDDQKKSMEDMKAVVQQSFMDHIMSDETDLRTAQIQVELKRKGRRWYATIADDYYDDIYGGYYSADTQAKELLSKVESGSVEELEKTYGSQIDNSDVEVRAAVHFLVDDIWNGNLRDVISCIHAGTDADGKKYDLDKGIKKFRKLLAQKASYDETIDALDDSKYSKVKKAWNKASEELNKLDAAFEVLDPEPKDQDYEADTTKLEKYLNKLIKLAY